MLRSIFLESFGNGLGLEMGAKLASRTTPVLEQNCYVLSVTDECMVVGLLSKIKASEYWLSCAKMLGAWQGPSLAEPSSDADGSSSGRFLWSADEPIADKTSGRSGTRNVLYFHLLVLKHLCFF